MKKLNTIGKLNLNKTALSQLNKRQLNSIFGGAALSKSCNQEEKHMPTSPIICK